VAYRAAKPVQAANVPLDYPRLTNPFTALGDDLISFRIVGVFLYFGMCIVNQRMLVQMRHKSLRRRIGDLTGQLPPEVNANPKRAVKVRSHGHPSLELVIVGKILHTPLSEPWIQKYGREFICARKVARCSVHDPNFSPGGEPSGEPSPPEPTETLSPRFAHFPATGCCWRSAMRTDLSVCWCSHRRRSQNCSP